MKSHDLIAPPVTALVSGFARSFVSGAAITDATITILENGQQFITDNKGVFGPIPWPVGKTLTLVFEKSGFRTTQSATITVPPEGINHINPANNISFQVPSILAFTLFSYAMGIKEDKNACQVTVTITPPNVTLDNIPQGESDVEAVLTPNPNVKPFYFGIFPLLHKTNPFDRSLKATSADGGVAFTNIPEGIYKLNALKKGVSFSEITVIARKGMLVNASPPFGVKALEYQHHMHTKNSWQNHFFKPAVVLGVGALVFATCGIGAAVASAAAALIGPNTVSHLTQYCQKKRKSLNSV